MALILTLLAVACVGLAVTDVVQRRDPWRRLYPLIGRSRGLLRFVLRLPELTESSAPFSKAATDQIRHRALNGTTESSFGADVPASQMPPAVNVGLFPAPDARVEPVLLGNPNSSRSFLLPRVNFGALGYGPVSGAVIEAVAHAARESDCLHNSGEDGLTKHHTVAGSRLVWQIGTGYAGCRDAAGNFSEQEFRRTLTDHPDVVAIEIKINQGAKPGAGGYLPAAKVSPRAARTLNVPPGTAVVSPAQHGAFASEPELLHFIERLRALSDGRPIGVKFCVGSRSMIDRLVASMVEEGVHPDYIVVDGAEGGTGSAPYVLQHHAGLPSRTAVPLLHEALVASGLRDKVRIMATGGVWNGFQVLDLIALGADSCYVVRSAMVAMGCLVARRCHSGRCPSGIATQTPVRARAINAPEQSRQLTRFHQSIVEDLQALLRAAGVNRVADLRPEHIIQLPADPLVAQPSALAHH